MTETAAAHKHWFTAIPTGLGPYGPQDIHLHNCVEGEPGDCWDAIVGLGRDCGGKDAPHEHMTLTVDGLQPAEALARLRASVPVAAISEQPPPHRYSFTRDELVDALTHLEAYPATAGPGQRVFINAESMADAIIGALEANRG